MTGEMKMTVDVTGDDIDIFLSVPGDGDDWVMPAMTVYDVEAMIRALRAGVEAAKAFKDEPKRELMIVSKFTVGWG